MISIYLLLDFLTLIMLMLQFTIMKQLLLIMQFFHVSLADEVARAAFAYSAVSFHHCSFQVHAGDF
mgnify:CR=1 FL=1